MNQFAQVPNFEVGQLTAWFYFCRYKENVVAKTLGMSVDAPFSNSDWKEARRQLNLTPRRFSKKFIASQLHERNEYRSKVRLLQKNPQTTMDFPYNVYMPNRVGSKVTAYCKKYHTLQRGSVLGYCPVKAMYMIEFENAKFGYEFCPDSDVSTREIPSLVIRNNDISSHACHSDSFPGTLFSCSVGY